MSFSCCFGSKTIEEKQQSELNRKIENDLQKEKKNHKKVKILLLGIAESGKSTFLKQMKIIHGHSLFEDRTVDEIKANIYQNIVRGMKVLIDARNKLNIDWGNQNNIKHGSHVFSYSNQILDTKQFLGFANSVIELWKDKGIQRTFDRRIEFQLSDGLRFLLDDLSRIATEDYMPSNQDILHSRKATKSITEYSVTINDVPFNFIDVGGQRTERTKWFEQFRDVTAVLFFVSSNEYDAALLEDRNVNRLRESVLIFKNIINHKAFEKVPFILFLNKTDLLKEKLNQTANQFMKLSSDSSKVVVVPQTIKDYFPEFNGLNPLDLGCVQSFIFGLFDSCRLNKDKTLIHHFTTAVDTENIKKVFKAVKMIILEENIKTILIQ
jgi:guanine nucleotide-binding protein subunit alpha-12